METTAQIAAIVLMIALTLGIVAWMAGAIYYDVARSGRWAWPLVATWIAVVVCVLVFWHPVWRPLVALLGVFVLFLAWWFSQKASHDRDWNGNAARVPRVDWNGDQFTIVNFRNTEYRSAEEYDPHYETRTFDLSKLCGVDALIAFWGSPWMCHPMQIFDFGTDGRICMSIEVRYRVDQEFNLLRSLYRQQEMIYIACDERDAILHRTIPDNGQDCYLYAMKGDLQEVRRSFLEYVEAINGLVERPRWYHGLTANCTTSIYRQQKGEKHWSWNLLVNGGLDRLLYNRHRLDQTLPFERLKERSRINEIANRAPRDGFGDYLRRELAVQRDAPAEILQFPNQP